MIIKLAKIVNEKKLKYWKLIIKFIVEINKCLVFREKIFHEILR